MKKTLCILLSLCILASCCLFNGCGNRETASENTETIADQAGREIPVGEGARRIVSCYYISTAGLLALGCGDRLVGIEEKADSRNLYRLAAPELLDLPAVGSGKGVNLEAVLALEPDLVVLPMKLKDDADRLAELGIRAAVVNPESEAAMRDCMILLGQLTGCEAEATALLSRYDDIDKEIAQRIEGEVRPRVYLAAESDFFLTYPSGMYQHTLIESAGGVNVAGAVEGSAKIAVDPEQLLLWDPEVIFLTAGSGVTREDVLGNPQLSSATAVQEGWVYNMPDGIESWDYPTPSSVLGKLYLASVLYPDAISWDELIARAAEFYREVYGIEADGVLMGLTDGSDAKE